MTLYDRIMMNINCLVWGVRGGAGQRAIYYGCLATTLHVASRCVNVLMSEYEHPTPFSLQLTKLSNASGLQKTFSQDAEQKPYACCNTCTCCQDLHGIMINFLVINFKSCNYKETVAVTISYYCLYRTRRVRPCESTAWVRN